VLHHAEELFGHRLRSVSLSGIDAHTCIADDEAHVSKAFVDIGYALYVETRSCVTRKMMMFAAYQCGS
jgi:hypothetical protein